MSETEKKQGLVPKLRFPEFSQEWVVQPLSEVLYEHKQLADSISKVHSVSVHKGVINQEQHLGRSFAAADTSRYNLVRPSDVVYTKSPTGSFPFGVVKQSHFEVNALVSPLHGVFEPRNSSIGYIVDAYFESDRRSSAFLAPLVQKGAKNTLQISNSRFLEGKLCLPKCGFEQRKIAECLRYLDELVRLEMQKEDGLRRYKRGLLQQFFPAKGEITPRLQSIRSPDNWQMIPLERLISGIGSGTSKSDSSGEFDLFGSTGIIGKTSEAPYSETCILIARVGANAGFLTYVEGKRFGASDNTLVLQLKPSVSTLLVLFCLQRLDLNKMAFGSGQPLITGSQLKRLVLGLPPLPDQEKIAAFFSEIDLLIESASSNGAALRTHKAALMQQLFPTLDGAHA